MTSVLRGPALVLDGDECVRLDRQLGEALRLAYLGRHLAPPLALVELADAVHRAAEQFRAHVQVTPGSGTGGCRTASEDRQWARQAEGLPVAQAAALTGVSESFIRRRLRGGHLAGDRSGRNGSWLVDAAALASWEASRTARK